MAWTGPVHSIRESRESIIEDGLCFMTSHNVLKSFSTAEDGDDYDYYFEVLVHLTRKK